MTQEQVAHLESSDLSIELAPPGSSDVHEATRFSPAAHLLQARYRGHSYLFHRGSPMEFDIGERTLPPGFEGCAPGKCFVKIGVGLLERDSCEPYLFSHAYPVRTRPETTMTVDRSSASFNQRLEPTDSPYGYALSITLKLEENVFTVDYTLENLGSVYFETEQYLHNFCCFDDKPLSPDYTVAVDYGYSICNSVGTRLEEPTTTLVRKIDDLRFGFDPSSPDDRAKVFFKPIGSLHVQRWSLKHTGLGRGLTIEANQPPQVSALYVTKEQISLEMNVKVLVEPGATARWTRRYEFH